MGGIAPYIAKVQGYLAFHRVPEPWPWEMLRRVGRPQRPSRPAAADYDKDLDDVPF